VLQQRKLHVLEKETRQPKQQLVQLVQNVENDVPQPLKAVQNVEAQQDVDELLVQKVQHQNVDDLQVLKEEVPAEQNVNVQHQNVDVLQQNVDVDKHQSLYSIFFKHSTCKVKYFPYDEFLDLCRCT
jgi:hypothetical protein